MVKDSCRSPPANAKFGDPASEGPTRLISCVLVGYIVQHLVRAALSRTISDLEWLKSVFERGRVIIKWKMPEPSSERNTIPSFLCVS